MDGEEPRGESTKIRWVVVVLCLAQFADVKGVTALIVALPAMLTELGADESAAAVVPTSYAASLSGFLVFGARIADRCGHRGALLVGAAVFGLGGLAGAVAGSVTHVVAARSLQGMAAACMVPATVRLLSGATLAPGLRARALAAWSRVGAGAGATGLVLGGLLTDTLGWRSVLALDAVLATVIVVATATLVPRGVRGAGVSLDVAGATLLTTGALLFVVSAALLRTPGWAGAATLVAGVLAAVMFVVHEWRSESPLLPVWLLRASPVRRGVVLSFLNTAATTSSLVTLTLVLQLELDLPATGAALLTVPFSLAVVVGAAVAGRMARRNGAVATTRLGLLLVAVGALGLVLVSVHPGSAPVAAAVMGFGLGLSSVSVLGGFVSAAGHGASYALVNTAAQLGHSVGAAVLLLLARSVTRPDLAGWSLAATAAIAGAALAHAEMRREPPPG